MRQFKISVLTLQNSQLTFIVDKYTISDGDFVEFIDNKTSMLKKFHASRCEITDHMQRGNSYGQY